MEGKQVIQGDRSEQRGHAVRPVIMWGAWSLLSAETSQQPCEVALSIATFTDEGMGRENNQGAVSKVTQPKAAKLGFERSSLVREPRSLTASLS